MAFHVFIRCAGSGSVPEPCPMVSESDRIYILIQEGGDPVTVSGTDADVRNVSADLQDFESVIDAVLDIASEVNREAEDAVFVIDVSFGDSIAVSAMTSAAFLIGGEICCTAYGRMHRYPVPSLPDIGRIKGLTKSALLIIASGSISNSELRRRLDLSPSHVGYYTGVLAKQGLIQSNSHGTEKNWYATYSGKVAARILARQQ